MGFVRIGAVRAPRCAALFAAALLAGTFTRGLVADESRYTLRFDDPRSTAEAERLLDDLERAFSEALDAGDDSPALRTSASRLVAAREAHADQTSAIAEARSRVEVARARLESDERRLKERKSGEEWTRLSASSKASMERQEAEYLGRIRAVTANREAVASRIESERASTRTLLAAFGGSWGALAIEKTIYEPQRTLRLGTGATWQRAMEEHAARFNSFVEARHGDAPCLVAAAKRSLLSHRIPAGTFPTVARGPERRPDPAPLASAPRVAPPASRAPHDRGEFEPVFPASTDDRPLGAAPSRPGGSTSAHLVENHGGFTWYLDFEEAAAEARRTGRLIYCLSTRPGCHMCEAVRDQSVVDNLADMQRVCVGYLYNIHNPTKDPSITRVDSLLRRNLVGATLMPLTGWVTPDLQWVHGFSGWREPSAFRVEVARARSLAR